LQRMRHKEAFSMAKSSIRKPKISLNWKISTIAMKLN